METIKYECPKRCHLYEQSFEEIVAAGSKHREKVVSLTEIAKEQKSKISSLREEKNSLLDQLDKLELDAKSDADLILRMTSETRSLKIEIRNIRMETIEKEEVIREKESNIEEIEFYKVKSKDLEDELFLKEHKIQELEEIVSKSKQTVGDTLENELNSIGEEKEHLKVKVDNLEDELRKMQSAEKSGKEKRNSLYQILDTLTEERKENLDKLREKIQKMKHRRLPKCWYGIKCKRLFCSFDHSNVFRKVNRNDRFSENSPPIIENCSSSILCEQCGFIFETLEQVKSHVETVHEEGQVLEDDLETTNEEPQGPKFQCRECSSIFYNRPDLNYHASVNHKEVDIECNHCGKYFVSLNELKDHKQQYKDSKERDEQETRRLANSLQMLLKNEGPSVDEKKKQRGDVSFKCNQCEIVLNSESSLRKHIKRSHETIHSNVPVTTNVCMKQSTKSRPLECGMCVIDFKSGDDMNGHMDLKHGGRWKHDDPDVIMLGDDIEESDFSESDEEISETENSESQSGEE